METSAAAEDAGLGARLEGLRGEVLAFLCRVTRDYHAAEDLTQEAFLRALRMHRGGVMPRRLRGWIFRVAYRAALDGMRRRARIPTFPLDGSAEVLPEPEQGPPSDVFRLAGRRIDRDRMLEELRGAVFTLPPISRELFLSRYGSGSSCREAASAVGISPANAKIRMMRGRRWIERRVLARLRLEGPAGPEGGERATERTTNLDRPAACAGA